MRIGVNCFLLEAHVGGIRQYFLTLFNWLLENDFANNYVFFHSEANLAELGMLRSARWRFGAKLLRSQEEIAYHLPFVDLYFCPFNAIWPRPVNIPSVVTLVDIQEAFYPQFFSPGDLYYRALHYPSSTRTADRVITISNFSKNSITKFHGVPSSKVVVAHLCADPSYFEAETIKAPPEPALPFSRFVLFPANRWRHKNHETVLLALRILKARGESVNVVFTGFDPQGGYPIKAKAIQYGVSDCVYLAGHVTIPQMAYLYSSAEMMVFPSLFEGFGMPPVEAMAVGCPVLVAKCTSLPEVCGDAAEYFEPTDSVGLAEAISRVGRDRPLREAMVQRGRTRAKQFSAEKMARAHMNAFVEAADSYSGWRFQWNKYLREPFHTWRVNKLRSLRVFEARSSTSSFSKKLIEETLRSSVSMCASHLRIFRKKASLIEASGLFQEEFYRSQIRSKTKGWGLMHYLMFGAKAGFDPNPLFSTEWYRQNHASQLPTRLNPLVHFILEGAAKSWNPHPLFDVSWYLAQNPDVAASGVNPLTHYLMWGAEEGRNPHPLFDASFYLHSVQDYDRARLNPLAHYLAQSSDSATNPHPLFDGLWYLKKNPHVAASALNPLVHYVTRGSFEGRDPSSSFDAGDYRRRHPNVIADSLNPLIHYLAAGAAGVSAARARVGSQQNPR